MKNIVVGTAGHIDHGKTTLVKALTGIDTDSLKEEKEKGITIEVGFAYYRLPSGQELSIIDVPGHEKFIKNMLRGISGVDIVMLVIAADDGPMPQTKEHLDIVSLLNVQYGLVVITKIDLVDDSLLQLATEETQNLLKDTFLEGSPCIYFSAKTGKGITEINQILELISKKVIEKNKDGIFRLPIDRAFTMKGHGTVVTGTIVSGSIKEGDEFELYPLGKRIKVRGIQVHNQKVSEAGAGQRVGINVPQLSVEELERGMVLGEVASLTPTHLLNTYFQYSSSNKSPLNNRTKVKFYCGTSESVGRVLFLDKQILFPGESCLVQFRLGEKITSAPFDRYIVRSLSPIATIGGGIILEPTLKKYRESDCDLLEYLHLLEKGVSEKLVEKLIENNGCCALGLKDIAQRVGAHEEEVKRVIDKLLQTGKAVDIGNKTVIHFKWYKNLREEIINRITDFHLKNPLERNMSREELKSKVGNNLNDRLYKFFLEDLIQHKKIIVENGRIKMSDHQVLLNLNSLQRRIADKLVQLSKEERFKPRSLFEMQEKCKGHSDEALNKVLKALLSEKVLIKLNTSRIIHEEALKEIKDRVKDYIMQNGTITLQEYKKLFSVGRLAAQLILEYLDEIKFTLRVGDERRLHK